MGGNQAGEHKPQVRAQVPLGFPAQAQNRMQQLVEKKLSMEEIFLLFM